MKSFRNRSTGKQRLPANWGKHVANTWMLLLPILIIACGSSLGKIQMENVDAVITKSETIIEQARLGNAQALVPQTLQGAESALESAKEAVKTKDEMEAIRLAYDALTQARITEQEAMYKSQEEGLNAIIQRKKAEISGLQANLRTVDAELGKTRTEMQQLDMQKSQLQAEMDGKIREVEHEHQKALHDYSTTKTELEQLQSKLDTTKTQLLQAQNKAEAHERQIYQLRRELALAQSMVKEARKEAEEAQTKATAQAQSYSKQIEQLDQSNVLKRRKDMLARKRREAQAYVQRQKAREPARTGSTSLTDEQIAKGKAVINDWALAWAARDINQHLSEYTQDATVEQIVIRSSSEECTYLNRIQLIDALKRIVGAQWKETDSEFNADRESVIGTYRFNRLSQDATGGELPVLYDVWTREVWVGQVGNQWKILREVWRIYEDVPKYATIFN